ncbi:MAG: hypothetical protein AAF330_05290 [Pseudomonadota bacterium]
MTPMERQDQINDAMDIVRCLQSLICEARDEITVEADGLYKVLDCVLSKLKAASA